MKKLIIVLLFGLSAIFTSCKDEIDSLFLNPDGATEAKVEYLFSAAIIETGAGLRIGYNPSGYYLNLQGLSPWIQLTGNSENDAKMMDLVNNAIANSWNAYNTGFMSKVMEMQLVYDGLPAEEQANYDVYMNMIKIVQANGTAKMTDMYGDIPYSEAFSSRTTAPNLFPKFDSQQEIYTSMLADLKSASAFLSTFTPNESLVHANLSKQDLLNRGDASKWVKFANSLRLRLAMRISDANPELAKATVNEVANSSLVLSNQDNILVDAESPNGLNTRTGEGGQNFIARAFNDRQERTYAGELMVDMMNAANDPRRAYYFSKTLSGEYIGVPSSPDKIAVISQDINADNYSKISLELVLDNLNLPGIAFTSAETHFLLAEAAMKGFIAGDAKVHYDMAMTESVYFYYQMVQLNQTASPVAPNPADITALLSTSSFAYDGTIEQLATQKWIHFGVNQAKEAWADWRRFDYPVLQENIPEGGGSALTIPVKVTIPDNEKSFNEASYEAVKAKDTPNSKVWWDTK